MTERITFQAKSLTSDGMGGSTSAWANIPSTPRVWAQIWPERGGEIEDQDRVNAVGRYKARIRRRSDINETMRMVWQGEIYNIRAVHRESAREKYMLLDIERGVAQ